MRNKALVKLQYPEARATRYLDRWAILLPIMGIQHMMGTGKTAAQAWRDASRSLAPRHSGSIRARVDRLIDWHEKQGQTCDPIRVSATANTVRKFARRRDGVYRYRKRIIVPIRPVRTRVEIAAEKLHVSAMKGAQI